MTESSGVVPARMNQLLTLNEFAALSALSDRMTTPTISAELEARLEILGLVERVPGGLKLTGEGIARMSIGK